MTDTSTPRGDRLGATPQPDPLDPDGLVRPDELATLRAAGLPHPLPTRAVLGLAPDAPLRVDQGSLSLRPRPLACLILERRTEDRPPPGWQEGPSYRRWWEQGPAVLWFWWPGDTLLADLRLGYVGATLAIRGISSAHALAQVQAFTALAHGLLRDTERGHRLKLQDEPASDWRDQVRKAEKIKAQNPTYTWPQVAPMVGLTRDQLRLRRKRARDLGE